MVFLGIVVLLIGLGMWWGYRQQPEKYVNKKTGKPIPARQVSFMAGALAVVGVAMATLGGGDKQPEPNTTVVDMSGVQVSKADNGTIVIDGRGFAPVDPSEPVAQVDIHDDKAIVKSAGVPVVRTSDSTDQNGEPKKIYIFNHKDVGAQVELSRTELHIAWHVYNDAPDARKNSEANVKVAQRLARAALGLEGGRLVDRMMEGKRFKQTTVAGHAVSSAACVGTMCAMTIAR